MTADEEAFANMKEWIAGAAGRQADDAQRAAVQLAQLQARGETLADSAARWEAQRAAIAKTAHDRATSGTIAKDTARRAARRARHTDKPEQAKLALR